MRWPKRLSRVRNWGQYTETACNGREGGYELRDGRIAQLRFRICDYVYEPGQYAVRGSIIDVFSFSSGISLPYRLFGDEVESVRTFEVETQLSKEKKESIVIVPDLSHSLEKRGSGGMVSFLDFLPSDSLFAMRDFLWLRERIQTVHDESLTHRPSPPVSRRRMEPSRWKAS